MTPNSSNSRLPRILIALLVSAGLSTSALAAETTANLCTGNEPPVAVDITEGQYTPPAFIVPDVQQTTGTTTPTTTPSGLIKEYANNVGLVQWHHLNTHIAPLTMICHYLNAQDTSVLLPTSTSTCSFDGQAHTVSCQ